MDMARVWPVLCQFGVGGVMCAAGLWYGLRSGYLDWRRAEDRRAVAVMVGGFLALLALAAAFTFWLPYLPKDGA